MIDLYDCPIWVGIGLIIIGFGLLMLGLAYGSYWVNVNICATNTIQVLICEDIVFVGKQAFVNIISGGDTTTVTIYKKLFPFVVIDRTYTSKMVIVKPI